MASWRDSPRWRNRLANSTIKIEFLHASPTSTTRPIWTKIFTELPANNTPTTEQSKHSGTTRITASGSDQLSYSAARARKTHATASAKTYSVVSPARICMNISSVHSLFMESDRVLSATLSTALITSPVLMPGRRLPLMEAAV